MRQVMGSSTKVGSLAHNSMATYADQTQIVDLRPFPDFRVGPDTQQPRKFYANAAAHLGAWPDIRTEKPEQQPSRTKCASRQQPITRRLS
jgi:hypothetical protein